MFRNNSPIGSDKESLKNVLARHFGDISVLELTKKPRSLWPSIFSFNKTDKPNTKTKEQDKYGITHIASIIGLSAVFELEADDKKGLDAETIVIPLKVYGIDSNSAIGNLLEVVPNPQFLFPLKERFGLISLLKDGKAHMFLQSSDGLRYNIPSKTEGTDWQVTPV